MNLYYYILLPSIIHKNGIIQLIGTSCGRALKKGNNLFFLNINLKYINIYKYFYYLFNIFIYFKSIIFYLIKFFY